MKESDEKRTKFIQLLGEIVNNQMQLLEDSLNIHKELTRLLINMKEAGIDLEKLYIESLEPLLNHSRQGTDLLKTSSYTIASNKSKQKPDCN